MADRISKELRSKIMSKIHGKDTKPELFLRKELFKRGIRYSLRYKFTELNFKPDIVLVSKRIVIYVDGCFWHKCPQCYNEVKSNRKYWVSKIQRNVERDFEQDAYLKKHGWKVIRVWEHDIRDSPEYTISKIYKKIKVYSSRSSIISLSK